MIIRIEFRHYKISKYPKSYKEKELVESRECQRPDVTRHIEEDETGI